MTSDPIGSAGMQPDVAKLEQRQAHHMSLAVDAQLVCKGLELNGPAEGHDRSRILDRVTADLRCPEFVDSSLASIRSAIAEGATERELVESHALGLAIRAELDRLELFAIVRSAGFVRLLADLENPEFRSASLRALDAGMKLPLSLSRVTKKGVRWRLVSPTQEVRRLDRESHVGRALPNEIADHMLRRPALIVQDAVVCLTGLSLCTASGRLTVIDANAPSNDAALNFAEVIAKVA